MKSIISIFLFFFSVSVFAQDASVSSRAANLRSKPSTKSRVVRVLPRGTNLSITDRKGNWYRVRSENASGWMHAVTIRFTEKSGRKPVTTRKRERGKLPIKAIFAGETNNPTLTITNNSIRKLDLVLGNVLYVIDPGIEKTIELRPGSYEFSAEARGLRPIVGVKRFVKKRSYTWVFNIEEPGKSQ